MSKINSQATRCPHCRASQKPIVSKKILIFGASTLSLIVVMGVVGMSLASPSDSKQGDTLAASATPKYQFADYAAKCENAVTNNKKVADTLAATFSEYATEAKNVPATSASSSAIAVRDQNLKQYQEAIAAGDQQVADETFKVAMRANDAAVAADKTSLQSQITLHQTLLDEMRRTNDSINKVRDRGARLQSCVESVQRQQPLTASDLSAINADIQASTSTPYQNFTKSRSAVPREVR